MPSTAAVAHSTPHCSIPCQLVAAYLHSSVHLISTRTRNAWEVRDHRSRVCSHAIASTPPRRRSHEPHRSRQPPSSTPSLQAVLDQKLRKCNSIQRLLSELKDSSHITNAVNVFTATTKTHTLLRQWVAQQSSSKSTNAETISQITVLESLLEILLQLTIQQAQSLTAKHCVSILTSHAWIRRIVCNSPTLQLHSSSILTLYHSPAAQHAFTAVCDKLAASENVTKSTDLSRAVWASVTLGHIHWGLAETASRALLERCTVVIQESEIDIQAVGKSYIQEQPIHQSSVSCQMGEHVTVNDEWTSKAMQLSGFANLVHIMGRAVGNVTTSVPSADSSNVQENDHDVSAMAQNSQDTALQDSKQETAQAGDTAIDTCSRLLQHSILLMSQGWLEHMSQHDVALLVDGTTQLLRYLVNSGAFIQHAKHADLLQDATLAVSRYVEDLCTRQNGTLLVSVQVAASLVTSMARMCQIGMHVTPSAPANNAITAASNSAIKLAISCAAQCTMTRSSDVRDIQNNKGSIQARVVNEHEQPLSQGSISINRSLTNMLYGLSDMHRIACIAAQGNASQEAISTENFTTSQVESISQLLNMSAKLIVENVHDVTALDLCKYAQAAAYFNKYMNEDQRCLIRTFAAQLDQLIPQHAADLQPDRLVTLLWSLVRLGITPVAGLHVLTARLRVAAVEAGEQVNEPVDDAVTLLPGNVASLDLIDGVQPLNVSRLCWALAKCDLSCLGNQQGWVLQQVEQAAAVHAPDMDNQSLVTTLWALTTLRHPCSDFLAAAAPLLQHRISLAGQSARTGTQTKPPHHNQHQQQSFAADNRDPTTTNQPQPLTAQQLSVCLWSAARAVSTPDVVLHGTDPLSLLTTAAPVAASMVSQLSGQGLAMVAVAYASAQVQPGKALLQALSAEAVQRRQQLDAAALSMIAWALSHFVLRDSAILLPLADELHNQLTAKHIDSSQGSQLGSNHNAVVQSQSELSSGSQPGLQTTAPLETTALSTTEQLQQHSMLSLSSLGLKQRPDRQHRMPAGVVQQTDAKTEQKPSQMNDNQVPLPDTIEPTVMKSVVSFLVSLAKAGLKHAGLMQLALHVLNRHVAFQHEGTVAKQGQTETTTEPYSVRQNGMVREVICCLWALSKSGQDCDISSLNAMIGYLEKRLLRVEEATDLIPGRQKRLAKAGKEKNSIDPRMLCILLQSFPVLGYQPSTSFLDAVCTMLSGRVSNMSSHNICEVIWALATLQYTPPQELMSEMITALEQRVLVSRQELLTLNSTLKLAWGLAYFEQYRMKLARHAIAKSLSCSPDSFLDKPSDQRMLLEVKLMCEGEARGGGFWRAVSLKWKDRVERGAPEKLSPAMAVQGHCDQAEYAALSRVSQEMTSSLASLGYHDARWQACPQGELACTFLAVPTSKTHSGHRTATGVQTETTMKSLAYTSMQSSRALPVTRMAIVLLCPWHYSKNTDKDGKPIMLCNAALHRRMLIKRGYQVVFIDFNEWDNASISSSHAMQLHHQQLLQQALKCYKPSNSSAVLHFR